METRKPSSPAARERAMDQVLKVHDQAAYKPKDRACHRRLAMVHLIRERARDYKKALGIK